MSSFREVTIRSRGAAAPGWRRTDVVQTGHAWPLRHRRQRSAVLANPQASSPPAGFGADAQPFSHPRRCSPTSSRPRHPRRCSPMPSRPRQCPAVRANPRVSSPTLGAPRHRPGSAPTLYRWHQALPPAGTVVRWRRGCCWRRGFGRRRQSWAVVVHRCGVVAAVPSRPTCGVFADAELSSPTLGCPRSAWLSSPPLG